MAGPLSHAQESALLVLLASPHRAVGLVSATTRQTLIRRQLVEVSEGALALTREGIAAAERIADDLDFKAHIARRDALLRAIESVIDGADPVEVVASLRTAFVLGPLEALARPVRGLLDAL